MAIGKARSSNPVCQKSDKLENEPIDTKKEIAKAANVSHDTIAKVKQIIAKATPEQKQKLSTGVASINEIHKQVKQAEKQEKSDFRIFPLEKEAGTPARAPA